MEKYTGCSRSRRVQSSVIIRRHVVDIRKVILQFHILSLHNGEFEGIYEYNTCVSGVSLVILSTLRARTTDFLRENVHENYFAPNTI